MDSAIHAGNKPSVDLGIIKKRHVKAHEHEKRAYCKECEREFAEGTKIPDSAFLGWEDPGTHCGYWNSLQRQHYESQHSGRPAEADLGLEFAKDYWVDGATWKKGIVNLTSEGEKQSRKQRGWEGGARNRRERGEEQPT